MLSVGATPVAIGYQLVSIMPPHCEIQQKFPSLAHTSQAFHFPLIPQVTIFVQLHVHL